MCATPILRSSLPRFPFPLTHRPWTDWWDSLGAIRTGREAPNSGAHTSRHLAHNTLRQRRVDNERIRVRCTEREAERYLATPYRQTSVRGAVHRRPAAHLGRQVIEGQPKH